MCTTRRMTRYFLAKRAGYICMLTANELGIPLEQAQHLLSLGSLWAEDRRCMHDLYVLGGTNVSVCLQPQRYLASSEVDWIKRIVHETDDFLVLNKPAGVPVHATKRNANENVISELRKLRGIDLYPPHRLDAPTSGLLVLSKRSSFTGALCEQLREGKVKKRYRAVVAASTEQAIAETRLVHYLSPAAKVPQLFNEKPLPGWKKCELDIIKVQQGLFSDRGQAYPATLLEIALLTGRTHQIRGQLAKLGYPILGDGVYGSDTCVDSLRKAKDNRSAGEMLQSDYLCLQASAISFCHPTTGERLHFTLDEGSAPWTESLVLLDRGPLICD